MKNTKNKSEAAPISNKNLLDSRIQNFKRMTERRAILNFGIVYSTPADVIEKIPGWIKEFVENKNGLRFDRCHFFNYGASSLDFELVFFVLNDDFNVLLDFQQQILLDIFKKFKAEGISFAYPTQSVYYQNLPAKI